MKKLLTLILGLSILVPGLLAQSYVSQLLATNTPVELVTTPATLKLMTLTATTANITTFKFYDNNDATAARTNVAYAATTTPLQYTTNWTSTWTNSDSVVITNSFSGLYVTTTVVAAVTNERPRIITVTVPASGQRTVTLDKRLSYGLVGQANYEGLVEVEYDPVY